MADLTPEEISAINAARAKEQAAAEAETASSGVGDGITETAPGPAATPPLDPSVVQQGQPPAAQIPTAEEIAVTTVAPNAPGTEEFVNPSPEQGMNPPIEKDSEGNPIPVVPPADRPGPISPQFEAQQKQQTELSSKITVSELAGR
jgi:hypothetical protein